MKRRCPLFFLVMLLFAASSHAQTLCPWVNQATVTDSPDGAVRAADTAVSADGNRCTFHYRDGDTAYSVEVTVQGMPSADKNPMLPEAPCASAKTPLTGIGNEAFACGLNKRGVSGEQVMGRVRDRHFLVIVSTKEKPGMSTNQQLLTDKTILIAEQVVGNMY